MHILVLCSNHLFYRLEGTVHDHSCFGYLSHEVLQCITHGAAREDHLEAIIGSKYNDVFNYGHSPFVT